MSTGPECGEGLGAPLGSDPLFSQREQDLIMRSTHKAADHLTFAFHDPHGAMLDMLRSQMLYPLSYERRVLIFDLLFCLDLGGTDSGDSI
jgi:hypothetical protein